ncbi:MAG: acyl-ACP--UDP-N-acetylglucosamine O-acyltransferase [candidate division WOR-3 bacterium]|nr:acyl-ACP--UDP-N-acetylglucosamine O-acyltransferase [candidate division WOR-3 bacterium]MCX7947862.1 acyl-ACP--UDP-N-acetylglucosamine O-acyltransferase [candidate division WOR-3 bacterium]MDW8150684.1 acyl-ACP--UDP-N-acetylglucosamine O-acyltransferase [candidate division WOR-3 bacterium]
MKFIHPTAKIGRNVKIGENTYIGENVIVEDNTIIGNNVVIEGYVKIGKNNKIFHNVVIGLEPQDVKYKGENTYVEIGDNNIIREFVSIHRSTGEGSKTIIGNDNYIMAYAHIAHNCKIGNGTIIVNAVQLAGHVEVGDYAYVSGLVGVHQFTRIGAYSIVSGMSRVNQDILPFSMVEGNPAYLIGINIVGLKRRGFTEERINLISEAFKIIKNPNLNLSDALKELEKLPRNEDIEFLINFIKTSQRGIIKRTRLEDD